MACHLVIPNRKYQTKGDRLTVDTVAASDHQCLFMFESSFFDRLHHHLYIFDNDFQRTYHLECHRCIDCIGACHTVVEPTALLSQCFGDRGSKSNKVMFGNCLNFINTFNREACIFNNFLSIFIRNKPQFVPCFDHCQFNIKPGLILCLHCPVVSHLFTRITFYHTNPYVCKILVLFYQNRSYKEVRDAVRQREVSRETASKHKKAEHFLKSAFEKKSIHKSYLAWVDGKLTKPFLVNEPIKINNDYSDCKHKVFIDNEGKDSHTDFRPLHYDTVLDATLVACYPLTGRTHQIRVHLFHVKHPILGDPIYGTTFQTADRCHTPDASCANPKVLLRSKLFY